MRKLTDPLTDKQAAALAYLQEYPFHGAGKLAAVLNISLSAAKLRMQTLRRRKLIPYRGPGRISNVTRNTEKE